MNNYHVIVKSTETDTTILDFAINCKLGYLVAYTKKRLLMSGYTYYNISKDLYMIVYINEKDGKSDNKITSMI